MFLMSANKGESVMRRRWLAACVALAAGALGITNAAQTEEKPILIGFAIGLTGWIAPYDTGYKSAEIAIAEINAKGGLLGRKLVTAYCDSKADREQGAKCGQEMVEKGADFIVVTCDYDFGGPAALSAARGGKISWRSVPRTENGRTGHRASRVQRRGGGSVARLGER